MKKQLQKTILLCALAILGWSNNVKAQTPNWVWATDTIEGIGGKITDGSGNVYIAHNLGTNTTFLSKHNSNGHTLWTKNAIGKSTSPHGKDYNNGIAFDPSGNIFVSGYFTSDSIVLETTTIHRITALDMFLAKYTNNGNLIWAKNVGVADIANTGFNVVSDAAGDAIVVGSFSTPTLTIGASTLINPCFASGVSCPTMLVAKFDGSNGNPIWADGQYSSIINGTSYAYSVVTDVSNNIYVGGDFAGSDGTVKYNSAGDTLWSQPNGGCFVANDASGNLYAATSNSTVQKIDETNGHILWSKSGTGSGNYDAVSITTDATGNIYFSGQFDADITFNSTTLVNAGQSDIFIVSYDNNGNLLWTKGLGGAGNDFINSSATDASGNVFVSGFVIGSSATVPLGFDAIDTIRTSIAYGGGIFVNLYFAKLGNNNTTNVKQLSDNNNQLSIYPNPANDILNINGITGKTTIKIYNVLGALIYELPVNNTHLSIDINQFTNGVYTLVTESDNGKTTNKIIINK